MAHFSPKGAAASRRWLAPLVVATGIGLAGCASAPQQTAAHPQDPWEGYNRSMMAINDHIDDAVLKPVATAYRDVTPQPVRTGVGNFFGNIGDLWTMVNFALQGNGTKAYNHMVRFTTNSVFGLGGLIDIATPAQIPREKQDFGLTLARWGMQPGPYLVLPFWGPSTLRDTVALPADWKGYVLDEMHPIATRNALTALRLTDKRASLLGTSDTLDAVALDRYSLVRDFYLRQRLTRSTGAAPPNDDAGRIEDFDD